jgi:hypothetical protein
MKSTAILAVLVHVPDVVQAAAWYAQLFPDAVPALASDPSVTDVEGPLKGFSGDNFDVGVGPMRTTFLVDQPPHQVGEKWQMTVDGVELTKTAS